MAHKAYPRAIQLADVLEVIADAIPNEMALITNEVAFTYAQLDERATRLANHLSSIGIRRGEHVGIHAQNCHEWVESFYACCKIGAVPVNVNYRYVEAELRYLYDNSDCVAVIAAPEYVSAIDEVRDGAPAGPPRAPRPDHEPVDHAAVAVARAAVLDGHEHVGDRARGGDRSRPPPPPPMSTARISAS